MDGVATGAGQAGSKHFEVIIVGAGIAGVGSAFHLKTRSPERTFKVLEAQETFGGTWHTHRYPGVRSDSDLHTFGYRFKAWRGVPIATGQEILNYMAEVIAENDLDQHIQYRTKILTARWFSAEKLWFLEAQRQESGAVEHYTIRFLWMCQGYYRHSEGYTPEWPEMASFSGRIEHPQRWPKDLDYAGKRVVVIGSGATAATLIPAMATDAAHVTMLQRSPTYFSSGRNRDYLAETLHELDIDEDWTHEIVRRRMLRDGAAFIHHSCQFAHPEWTTTVDCYPGLTKATRKRVIAVSKPTRLWSSARTFLRRPPGGWSAKRRGGASRSNNTLRGGAPGLRSASAPSGCGAGRSRAGLGKPRLWNPIRARAITGGASPHAGSDLRAPGI